MKMKVLQEFDFQELPSCDRSDVVSELDVVIGVLETSSPWMIEVPQNHCDQFLGEWR